MKSIYKVFAVIAVLALAIVPVTIVADSSDAGVNFDGVPTVTTGFNDGGSGTVTVKLSNDTTSDANVRVKAVEYKNESHVYTSSDVTVPKAVDEVPGVAETKLTWTIDSSGDKTVSIIIYSLDASGNETEIAKNTIAFNVSHSIWKDAATYVIIIVVIIAIVIAVFIYLRSKESKRKKDPAAKTFTQMREEKLAGKNVSTGTEKKAVSVEKKTYEASSERKSKRKQ